MRYAGLFALSLVFFSGCSFLQVHSYYTPSALSGELEEEVISRCGGNQGHVVSGPPQRIVVRSDEVALGIQAGAYRVTTVAAGPLSIPVIPAIPPSFFPHHALVAGDVLPIDFRILEPRDEIVDFSGAVVEIESQASAPSNTGLSNFEAGDISEELVEFKEWTSLWDLSDGWTLPMRVRSGEAAPFRVSVRGLSLRGKKLEFPDVEFTPARGWLVCEAR